ncbi:MAG: HNH endonuclease signature motif containing protein [Actinomycetota bacterium]
MYEHLYVDAHHLIHWVKDGKTEPANLMLVCRFHHRLLHEGRFSVERMPNGELIYRRPTGNVIPKVCTPEARGPDLGKRNGQEGVKVDDRTCLTLWDGGLCDYGTAVDHLYWLEGYRDN